MELYQLFLNYEEHWVPLFDACFAYAYGWVTADLGKTVLLDDGSVRQLTDEELRTIIRVADEWSS